MGAWRGGGRRIASAKQMVRAVALGVGVIPRASCGDASPRTIGGPSGTSAAQTIEGARFSIEGEGRAILARLGQRPNVPVEIDADELISPPSHGTCRARCEQPAFDRLWLQARVRQATEARSRRVHVLPWPSAPPAASTPRPIAASIMRPPIAAIVARHGEPRGAPLPSRGACTGLSRSGSSKPASSMSSPASGRCNASPDADCALPVSHSRPPLHPHPRLRRRHTPGLASKN